MSVTAYLLFGSMALIGLATIAAAVTGRDIDCFERMCMQDSKKYHEMKGTLRFNGLLVGLMCLVMMIGTPIAVLTGDISALFATLAFIAFAVFLWLSVRWTRWAYS